MDKNKQLEDCLEEGMCAWIMSHTDEPVRTIFTAIRTCYSEHDQEYLAYEEWFKYLWKVAEGYPNDAVRLLCKVAAMKHLSVLEHVSFTFGIRGVSRSLLAQLTRHRIGWSYSVQSQRYVDLGSESKSKGFKYFTPEAIKNDKPANGIFKQAMRDLQRSYDILRMNGIKPEDARYLLPNATETNLTVTCNFRAFLDFYSKRSTKAAQWEIRELAEVMKSRIIEIEPDLEFVINEYINQGE